MKDTLMLKALAAQDGLDLEPAGPEVYENDENPPVAERLSPHDHTQWKLAQERVERAAVQFSLDEMTLEKLRLEGELRLLRQVQNVNRARAELNARINQRERYASAMRLLYMGLVHEKSTWDPETGRIQTWEPDPEESETDVAAADES